MVGLACVWERGQVGVGVQCVRHTIFLDVRCDLLDAKKFVIFLRRTRVLWVVSNNDRERGLIVIRSQTHICVISDIIHTELKKEAP